MMARILKSAKFDPNQRIEVLIGGQPAVGNGDLPEDVAGEVPLPPDPAEQAEAMLSEAQQHVEQMLNQARTQVDVWQEEARQQGLQAGYESARQAVEAELTEVVQTAQEVLQSLLPARDAFFNEAREHIADLALAVARKIIGREITLDPKTVTDIVATVIDQAQVEPPCRVHVHPKDYDLLHPHWEAVAALQRGGDTWELVSDQQVSRGGCVLEIQGGSLDAQLDTQLNQVARTFAQVE